MILIAVGMPIALVLATHIRVVEMYTLPAAFLVFTICWWRVAPTLRPVHSWFVYAPGILIGLTPSSILAMAAGGPPERRIVVVVGAAVCLAVGLTAHADAPLVLGALVLAVAVIHDVLHLGWPAAGTVSAIEAVVVLAAALIVAPPVRAGVVRDFIAHLMVIAGVATPLVAWLVSGGRVVEAASLPSAVGLAVVGFSYSKWHPGASSWRVYGPALVVGFAPSLIRELSGDPSLVRRVGVLLAAALVTAYGSLRRLQMPTALGLLVFVIAGIHELFVLRWLLVAWTAIGVLIAIVGYLVTPTGRSRVASLTRSRLDPEAPPDRRYTVT
jgi:hypothetical protein